jgi:hypothetical protein
MEDSQAGSARDVKSGGGGVYSAGGLRVDEFQTSARIGGVLSGSGDAMGGSVRGLPRSGIGGPSISGLTAPRQLRCVCECQQFAEMRPMSHQASVDGGLKKDNEGTTGRCGTDTGPAGRMRSASNSLPRKRWAYPFL